MLLHAAKRAPPPSWGLRGSLLQPLRPRATQTSASWHAEPFRDNSLGWPGMLARRSRSQMIVEVASSLAEDDLPVILVLAT